MTFIRKAWFFRAELKFLCLETLISLVDPACNPELNRIAMVRKQTRFQFLQSKPVLSATRRYLIFASKNITRSCSPKLTFCFGTRTKKSRFRSVFCRRMSVSSSLYLSLIFQLQCDDSVFRQRNPAKEFLFNQQGLYELGLFEQWIPSSGHSFLSRLEQSISGFCRGHQLQGTHAKHWTALPVTAKCKLCLPRHK